MRAKFFTRPDKARTLQDKKHTHTHTYTIFRNVIRCNTEYADQLSVSNGVSSDQKPEETTEFHRCESPVTHICVRSVPSFYPIPYRVYLPPYTCSPQATVTHSHHFLHPQRKLISPTTNMSTAPYAQFT